MSVATQEKRVLLQRARDRQNTTSVVFVGDTGIMPIELPGEIDHCEYDAQTGKQINKVEYRPFEFGVAGRMELNPQNAEDDAFIERARKLLRLVASGEHRDPRISRLGVREVNPKSPPMPMRRWDDNAAEVVVAMVSNLMGENHAENLEMLDAMFEYELANLNRRVVIDGLELLASDPAVEDPDVEVEA